MYLGIGWYNVVFGCEGALRKSHLGVSLAKGFEGLWGGDLVNQVQPYKELILPIGQGGYFVKVPNLVVKRIG
jgi:hypothetical protein